MKLIYILILCFCFINLNLSGQDSGHYNSKDCRNCHSCDHPTSKNPCLKKCPRLDMMGGDFSADDAPDVIYMDGLSEMYVPVVFSHKLHAQMADMSGGCQICHHHSADEEITGCVDCHPSSAKRADLSRPSLKAAYHRQCLGCHREWSHDTKCVICHALKTSRAATNKDPDSTDIIGSEHPPIPEPERIVYETKNEDGRLVTFYHNEHINLFRLKCVDCHQTESCKKCHDLAKFAKAEVTQGSEPVTIQKSDAEHHKACYRCHIEQKCSSCHSGEIKDPFNHYTRSGFDLNKYHQDLNCQKCHTRTNCYTGLKKKCANCHQNWSVENFKHKVTGLMLDENHSEVECDVCHSDNNFTRKPACAECHDNDISYPEKKPGKVIN